MHMAGRNMDCGERGLLDLGIIPPHLIASLSQDVQLVTQRLQSHPGKKVAGVAVLSDETERFALPHSTNHDTRARLLYWLGVVHGLRQAIVLAFIGSDVSGPHLMRDLQ